MTTLKKVALPSNPLTDYIKLFASTDGSLKQIDEDGVVSPLGGGGSGGGDTAFIVGADQTYTTIQAGIDAANTEWESSGVVQLVRIMPGEYTEDVVLKSGVTICGAPMVGNSFLAAKMSDVFAPTTIIGSIELSETTTPGPFGIFNLKVQLVHDGDLGQFVSPGLFADFSGGEASLILNVENCAFIYPNASNINISNVVDLEGPSWATCAVTFHKCSFGAGNTPRIGDSDSDSIILLAGGLFMFENCEIAGFGEILVTSGTDAEINFVNCSLVGGRASDPIIVGTAAAPMNGFASITFQGGRIIKPVPASGWILSDDSSNHIRLFNVDLTAGSTAGSVYVCMGSGTGKYTEAGNLLGAGSTMFQTIPRPQANSVFSTAQAIGDEVQFTTTVEIDEYTVIVGQHVIEITNNEDAPAHVVLPDVTSVPAGYEIIVVDLAGTASSQTIAMSVVSGGGTIRGTATITTDHGIAKFVAGSTAWYRVN